MNFPNPQLTDFGISQIIKGLAGETITFTRIKFGNGDEPENPKELLEIVNPLMNVNISYIEFGNQYAELTFNYDNGNLESGFWMKEMGVYALDPDTQEEGLYAYSYAGEMADWMQPYDSTSFVKTTMKLAVVVGDAENVSATIGEYSGYASNEEFKEHLRDNNNPHQVNAEQVGLGNVPNLAPSDMTVDYSMSGTNEKLNSGESLKILFGKLARIVASFISHLGAGNPHNITLSKIGAAASSHSHSTTNITSGILSVARGGTGVSTLSSLWSNLWSGRHGYLDNSKYIYGKDSEGTNRRLIGINSSNETFIGSDAESDFSGKLTHLHSCGGFCFRVFSGSQINGEKLHYYTDTNTAGTFYPSSNIDGYDTSVQNLGSSSHRWNVVYGISTNMSSDRKLKDKIDDLDIARELIMGLFPVSYSWKSDKDKRPRYGFIAQDTYALMKKLGINNSALYTAGYTVKGSHHAGGEDIFYEDLLDDEIDKMNDEDLEWGIDYVQLIAPIVKVLQCQERRIEELEKALKGVKSDGN